MCDPCDLEPGWGPEKNCDDQGSMSDPCLLLRYFGMDEIYWFGVWFGSQGLMNYPGLMRFSGLVRVHGLKRSPGRVRCLGLIRYPVLKMYPGLGSYPGLM